MRTAIVIARRNPVAALVGACFLLALCAAAWMWMRSDVLFFWHGLVYVCAIWGAADIVRRVRRDRQEGR